MVLKPFVRPSKTMYNETMGCLGGVAHGFKTICKANFFFADNSIFYFLLFCQVGTLQQLPHIVLFFW